MARVTGQFDGDDAVPMTSCGQRCIKQMTGHWTRTVMWTGLVMTYGDMEWTGH